MTQQYVTDHAVMERALLNWFVAQAGLLTARWLNQASGRPLLPYGTLQVTADGVQDGGTDAETGVYNQANESIDVATHGPRRFTLQCTVYTGPEASANHRNARHRLAGLIASLRSPKVKEDFDAAGLSFFRQLTSVLSLDEQLGDRWERRSAVDLELGYESVFTDTSPDGGTGWIETTPIPLITYL